MYISAKSTSQFEPTEIAIDCPLCGSMAASATAVVKTEQVTLMFVLPLFKSSYCSVTCHQCSMEMLTRASIEDLASGTPAENKGKLAPPEQLAGAILAIFALLCVWLPFVNLIPTLIAVAINADKPGFWRRFAIGVLVLAIVLNLALIPIVMLFGP